MKLWGTLPVYVVSVVVREKSVRWGHTATTKSDDNVFCVAKAEEEAGVFANAFTTCRT